MATCFVLFFVTCSTGGTRGYWYSCDRHGYNLKNIYMIENKYVVNIFIHLSMVWVLIVSKIVSLGEFPTGEVFESSNYSNSTSLSRGLISRNEAIFIRQPTCRLMTIAAYRPGPFQSQAFFLATATH